MILGLVPLLAFQLVGEVLARGLALPAPGPVVGLALPAAGLALVKRNPPPMAAALGSRVRRWSRPRRSRRPPASR